MKTALILLLTLCCSGLSLAEESPKPASQDAEWNGSIEQKVFGLMVVWSEAKGAFPFFDRIPGVDWDAKVREYVPRVIAAQDLDAYYRVLMEFAALLHDGHTAVNPPWGPFKPGADWPPIEIQVVEERFIVARTGDTDELRASRVYPGLEVVEIDDVPVRSYYAEHVLRYNSRGTKQADEAINLYGLLTGPKGSNVALAVRDIDGTTRRIMVTRDSADRDGDPFLYRLLRWYTIEPLLESRQLPGGIVLVKIANFDNDGLPGMFDSLIDSLDLAATRGMILDLRFNPGGNSAIAAGVTRSLIDRPVASFITRVPNHSAADRGWGNPRTWTEFKGEIEPRQGRRYNGPLIILTGPATYSSAEDFIVPLHAAKRARLVGERTAGSTGNPLRVPLPGGGNFRVVTVNCVYPDGREFVGSGITPDIEIHPTQKSIYEGRDPVLERAVEEIEKMARSGAL